MVGGCGWYSDRIILGLWTLERVVLVSPQSATDLFSLSPAKFCAWKQRPLLVGVSMNQPLANVLEKQRLFTLVGISYAFYFETNSQ